ITVPDYPKSIICVAPHTSNWDFILGLLAYKSVGRKANFLMKESWFFFPLKYVFRHFGGIPVTRSRKGDLTTQLIRKFKETDYMNLAITPEGTRSGKAEWHTGFLRIAYGAGVLVQLGVIDYKHKQI
ncbi:MAG: 1-acyl-sn-glycerol-3-phosphate acyltransferase, partial [Muribaculaceae bacterium]|nr:1-acyl-sn-glycerol-3-phosphate acyltransferase [Muribaculaceae bacterium]